MVLFDVLLVVLLFIFELLAVTVVAFWLIFRLLLLLVFTLFEALFVVTVELLVLRLVFVLVDAPV